MARRTQPVTKERLAELAAEVAKLRAEPLAELATQLVVRVPAELAAFIASEVERLRVERPGTRVNGSDVVRDVLFAAMRARAASSRAGGGGAKP
jgi:hypothetical protein